jgi:hypothetical protein
MRISFVQLGLTKGAGKRFMVLWTKGLISKKQHLML